MAYIKQVGPVEYRIEPGFVPGMRVPGYFYVNDALRELVFDELAAAAQRGDHGGFLPAVKQIANVAALPGIVRRSIALPDVHSGAPPRPLTPAPPPLPALPSGPMPCLHTRSPARPLPCCTARSRYCCWCDGAAWLTRERAAASPPPPPL